MFKQAEDLKVKGIFHSKLMIMELPKNFNQDNYDDFFVETEEDLKKWNGEDMFEPIYPYILHLDHKEFDLPPESVFNRFALEYKIPIKYMGIDSVVFHPDDGYRVPDSWNDINICSFDKDKVYLMVHDIFRELQKNYIG